MLTDLRYNLHTNYSFYLKIYEGGEAYLFCALWQTK